MQLQLLNSDTLSQHVCWVLRSTNLLKYYHLIFNKVINKSGIFSVYASTLNEKPNFWQEKMDSDYHCIECPSPVSYPIHLTKPCSQIISFPASVAATYSASVVDKVTIFCRFEAHDIVVPPRVKTNPVVLFLLSISPAKSAST